MYMQSLILGCSVKRGRNLSIWLTVIASAIVPTKAQSQSSFSMPESAKALFAKMRPKVTPFDATAIDAMAKRSGIASCFWVGTISPDTFNILFPDTGSTYWASQVVLPAGSKLQLRGKYPKARYISFNTYDGSGQPVDRINDTQIKPEAGSVNPFGQGASRNLPNRSYQVQVVPRDIKAGTRVDDSTREPNTVFASEDGGAVQLLYRVYIPDTGNDARGGVSLPEPVLTRKDGTILQGEKLCSEIVKKDGAVRDVRLPAEVLKEAYAIPGRSPFQPAQRDPKWDAFFNSGLSATRVLIGTDLEPIRERQDVTRTGGSYSTLDNTYITMYIDNRFGKVLMLHGKVPKTPKTRDHSPVMREAELRYWSVCKYRSFADTAVDSCLYDEEVPQSDSGYATIVISKPEDRPLNARNDCGVAWMSWGIGDGMDNPHGGFLIWRQMMPSAEYFPHSIFATTKLNQEKTVMGDYYPQPRYMSREAFEREMPCTKTVKH